MTVRKNYKVVSNIIVKEKIKFQVEKITRERIEKKWEIPEIITNDIGFQMMFGFDAPMSPKKGLENIEEYYINENI